MIAGPVVLSLKEHYVTGILEFAALWVWLLSLRNHLTDTDGVPDCGTKGGGREQNKIPWSQGLLFQGRQKVGREEEEEEERRGGGGRKQNQMVWSDTKKKYCRGQGSTEHTKVKFDQKSDDIRKTFRQGLGKECSRKRDPPGGCQRISQEVIVAAA